MHRRAFSLVELSIVLVILGLLVGGVLSGQSLIKAAQLRGVTTEYNRYFTAVQSFKDKYFAIPGDMTNATSFWGALDTNDGIGADCRGESSGTATCNGNGDGQICTDLSCSAGTWEMYLFWKHLANAGLIEGSYTGNSAYQAGNTKCTLGTASNQSFGGCNVPASKLSGMIWDTFYQGNLVSNGYLFDGSYGNIFSVYAGPGVYGWANGGIAPADLWNIDKKIDDGSPATGKLVASRWNLCATGAASQSALSSAAYDLADPTTKCVAIFRNAY